MTTEYEKEFQQFQKYLKDDPRDESLKKLDRWITKSSYVVMSLAVLYFGSRVLYFWLTGGFN